MKRNHITSPFPFLPPGLPMFFPLSPRCPTLKLIASFSLIIIIIIITYIWTNIEIQSAVSVFVVCMYMVSGLTLYNKKSGSSCLERLISPLSVVITFLQFFVWGWGPVRIFSLFCFSVLNDIVVVQDLERSVLVSSNPLAVYTKQFNQQT